MTIFAYFTDNSVWTAVLSDLLMYPDNRQAMDMDSRITVSYITDLIYILSFMFNKMKVMDETRGSLSVLQTCYIV